MKAAGRDYLLGVRYAFGRKMEKDITLHRSVLVSILGIGTGVILVGEAIVGPEHLARLLMAIAALAVGLGNAGWVVHRYRRRNYPPPDALATAVHATLDKAEEIRKRRESKNN